MRRGPGGGPFADAAPLRPPEERGTFSRAAAGERKNVTVLFSDMSGYTTLTQSLDPEEVRAIISAREIHERVAAFSRSYEEQIGQRLAMHSGIHTGLVVIGNVDFEEGTHGIAGAPLNIAARLCGFAGPGEILVGDETYRHALGYFNFLALDSVAVKGVSAPIQLYRVVSLIDRPKKIHRFHGLRADLIGRSPELTTLAEALDRVRAWKGRLVAVCGTADATRNCCNC